MTSHHITSHHITSHHITSHHITSHHITSHHITSNHITSHHITSHHITPHHITPHHTTPHHTTPHHTKPHHTTPHHTTPHHTTPHHTRAARRGSALQCPLPSSQNNSTAGRTQCSIVHSTNQCKCSAQHQAVQHHTNSTDGAARHAGCSGPMRPCVTARRRRQGSVGQVRKCTGPAMQQHTYTQRAHNTHSPARLPVPVGRHPGLCLLVIAPSAHHTTSHQIPSHHITSNHITIHHIISHVQVDDMHIPSSSKQGGGYYTRGPSLSPMLNVFLGSIFSHLPVVPTTMAVSCPTSPPNSTWWLGWGGGGRKA